MLPPLRERRDDIPALVEHFSAQVCAQNGWKPVPFTADAMEALQSYSWPGNVRELRDISERLHAAQRRVTWTSQPSQIALPRVTLQAEALRRCHGIRRARDRVQSFEREVIRAELRRSHQNMSLAAKHWPGAHHLYKKAEQLGIDLRAMRGAVPGKSDLGSRFAEFPADAFKENSPVAIFNLPPRSRLRDFPSDWQRATGGTACSRLAPH